MLGAVQQNSASKFFVIVLDADNDYAAGLSSSDFEVTLCKPGAAGAVVSVTFVERMPGVYEVTPLAAHRDTLGENLWRFEVVASGFVYIRLEVVLPFTLAAVPDRVHNGTVINGVANSGSSQTVVNVKSIAPSLAVADQLKGRVLLWKTDTATAALRGQGGPIAANNTSTITVEAGAAFTTAPSEDDAFTIV